MNTLMLKMRYYTALHRLSKWLYFHAYDFTNWATQKALRAMEAVEK